MSKNIAVLAFFREMSAEPNQAPSMRAKASILAPASTIEIFILVLSSTAFAFAAAIIFSACSGEMFILIKF